MGKGKVGTGNSKSRIKEEFKAQLVMRFDGAVILALVIVNATTMCYSLG